MSNLITTVVVWQEQIFPFTTTRPSVILYIQHKQISSKFITCEPYQDCDNIFHNKLRHVKGICDFFILKIISNDVIRSWSLLLAW